MSACRLIVLVFACVCYHAARAQDSTSFYAKAFHLPDKFFSASDKYSHHLEKQLDKQTTRYLQKLANREKRLKSKLARTDSSAANRIFGNTDSLYKAMGTEKPGSDTEIRSAALSGKVYIGHLDSMQTALRYLTQNKLIDPAQAGKLTQQIADYQSLQNKFNNAGDVSQLVVQRQQWLAGQLQQTPLAAELNAFKQQVYYYRAQVDVYKQSLQDPSRLENSLLDGLRKVPSFQSFFDRNSQLASLFRLPGSGTTNMASVLTGLQCRDQVIKELQARLGAGPDVMDMMQSQIGEGQAALDKIKDKAGWLGDVTGMGRGTGGSGSLGSGAGGGGSGENGDMPEFKPNNQRTKTFLQRIEVGTNLQTTASNNNYPTTADIGLSLGYRLSSKCTIGIGGSYKLGTGRDIQHMSFSSQGTALRSFLDLQVKGSWWISGGSEFNYQKPFSSLNDLKHYSQWQQSALLGLMRKYKVGKKMAGNIQVLYNFLWDRQTPATQPVVFRVGYSF